MHCMNIPEQQPRWTFYGILSLKNLSSTAFMKNCKNFHLDMGIRTRVFVT